MTTQTLAPLAAPENHKQPATSFCVPCRAHLLGLFLIGVSLFGVVAVRGDTVILGGPVTGRWDLAGSPYLVQSNINIPAGAQLIVAPGVTARFQTNTSLQITGSMVAQGTATDRITFTSGASTPAAGDWLGLQYRADAQPASLLEYADVSHGETGISISGNTPAIIVSRSRIHHNSRDGIAVSAQAGEFIDSSEAALVANEIFENGAYGVSLSSSASGCSGSAVSAVVRENFISRNGGAGIRVNPTVSSGSGCIVIQSSSIDSVIERNWIWGNPVGVSVSASRPSTTPAANIPSARPTIRNNLIASNAAGLSMSANAGAVLSPKAFNNTIVWNSGTGISHAEHMDSGFALHNNLIVWNGGGVTASAAGFAPTNGWVAHNLIYGNTNGNWHNYPAEFGTLSATNLNGQPADENMNISAEPYFVGLGDFHLHKTSPAVNAGSATNLVSADFDGRPRFAPADIGCYEVQPEIRFETPKRHQNGQISLRIHPDVARHFTLECSADFLTWTNVVVVTNAIGTVEIPVDASQSPRRFYRVRP